MMRLNATILASTIGIIIATATDLRGAGEDGPKAVVATDLLRKVELIGILRKPLGSMTTIRGTWHRVINGPKNLNAIFQVTHVDGMPATWEPAFDDSSVHSIASMGGAAIKAARSAALICVAPSASPMK